MEIDANVFWYCQLAVIILVPIVVSTVVVRRFFQDDDERVVGGFIGGIVLLFVTLWAVTSFANHFTFQIIRVEDGAQYKKLRIVCDDSRKWFKSPYDGEVKYGKTYIENMSGKDIVIDPVTYVRYAVPVPNFLTGRKAVNKEDNNVAIASLSTYECGIVPDYFFETPESISVSGKKNDFSQKENVKWVLRYARPCMP